MPKAKKALSRKKAGRSVGRPKSAKKVGRPPKKATKVMAKKTVKKASLRKVGRPKKAAVGRPKKVTGRKTKATAVGFTQQLGALLKKASKEGQQTQMSLAKQQAKLLSRLKKASTVHKASEEKFATLPPTATPGQITRLKAALQAGVMLMANLESEVQAVAASQQMAQMDKDQMDAISAILNAPTTSSKKVVVRVAEQPKVATGKRGRPRKYAVTSESVSFERADA